jgi:hypothetical protein
MERTTLAEPKTALAGVGLDTSFARFRPSMITRSTLIKCGRALSLAEILGPSSKVVVAARDGVA